VWKFWPYTNTAIREEYLPSRVSREEIVGRIPVGTPFKKVVEVFGWPYLEIRPAPNEIVLSYLCDESAPVRPNTYYGFTVFLIDGKVTNFAFDRDQHSPRD